MEERIKSIASTTKPDFKMISDVIEDAIILNYFIDNLKKEVIKEKIDLVDLRNLVSADYYLGFNKKDRKEIIQLLNKQDSNALIDYCTLGLIKKEKHRYNKRPKLFDSFLNYRNDMNVEILSASYMDLLKNNEIKNLIKQSYDIKDLKAIIFMDILMPVLDESYSKQIINSELNPEQKALEFAKAYQVCKDIRKIEKVFANHNHVSAEEIFLLYDIKKSISTNLQLAVYTKSKDIPDNYQSYLQQLKDLFDEKLAHGIRIISRNISNIEREYNLDDCRKKGYFGFFVRKKRLESAKKELLAYHGQFNKIKELIRT